MTINIHSYSKQLSLVAITLSVFSAQAMADDLLKTDFDCLIEPKMTVMVGAATQGVIRSVDVERNDLVKKGQLLATLESKVEQAALDHARVRSKMESEIQARQADYKLAQVNLRRIKELSSKQIVPTYQLDEAEAHLEVSHMAVTQAERTWQSLRPKTTKPCFNMNTPALVRFWSSTAFGALFLAWW